jgi:hypothetical protein
MNDSIFGGERHELQYLSRIVVCRSTASTGSPPHLHLSPHSQPTIYKHQPQTNNDNETAMTEEPKAKKLKRTKLSSAEKEKRNQLLENLQKTGEFERYVFQCL